MTREKWLVTFNKVGQGLVDMQPKKILLVKNRALGDSIFGLSSVQYIKSRFQDSLVIYALPAWTRSLYLKVDTAADDFLPINTNSAIGQLKLFGHLFLQFFIQKYDLIIELQENPRTNRILKLFSYLTRTPYFSHNHHLTLQQSSKSGVHDQGIRKSIIQRDLDGVYSALKSFDQNVPYPFCLNNSPQMKTSEVGANDLNTIVLGIVATRDEKKWPIKSYAQLIDLLAEKFNSRFVVPISSSQEDKKLVSDLLGRVSSKGKNIHVIEKPLSELPFELAKGSLYIGNDTGLKHICAALGLKTFTLFGPEEPLEWHPYDLKNHHYFWIYGQDARTQMREVCLLKQFDQSAKLSSISVEEVFQYIEKHFLNGIS